MNDPDDEIFDDTGNGCLCPVCDGTGGDPMNDGITPCVHCDGAGYEWWE